MMHYVAYAKQKFISNSVFRFNHFMGVFNTCLQFFIFWCIYKALYGKAEVINGITFQMVTTNFIIIMGLNAAFSIDQYYLPSRINNGSIGNELLKPVSFKGLMLAADFGNICFQILFNFLPALIIAIIAIGILKPVSVIAFVAALLSAVLGFFILWTISFLVQTLAFWVINIWSIRTITNVFINILSGSMIPLWFMPDWMQGVINYTPFSSIYFMPVQIYLGEMKGAYIWFSYIRQGLWIILIYLLGELLWKQGIKKLVVQGG